MVLRYSRALFLDCAGGTRAPTVVLVKTSESWLDSSAVKTDEAVKVLVTPLKACVLQNRWKFSRLPNIRLTAEYSVTGRSSCPTSRRSISLQFGFLAIAVARCARNRSGSPGSLLTTLAIISVFGGAPRWWTSSAFQ